MKFRFGVYVTAPAAVNPTVPFVPCVTLVSVRPPSSKLSAFAPLVPVITFAVIAVSSFVVNVSATMSATAVTVIPTVSVSVKGTPALSVESTVSVSVPLKSAFPV